MPWLTTTDKATGPLQVGRAGALNARTQEIFELAGILDELEEKGLKCDSEKHSFLLSLSYELIFRCVQPVPHSAMGSFSVVRANGGRC